MYNITKRIYEREFIKFHNFTYCSPHTQTISGFGYKFSLFLYQSLCLCTGLILKSGKKIPRVFPVCTVGQRKIETPLFISIQIIVEK